MLMNMKVQTMSSADRGSQAIPPRTASELFQLIAQSELIERPRLVAYWESLKAAEVNPADAMECAQLMVCDGILTQFQAKLLLQGKWKNFFLGGKYKVLDQLGSGGMGTVFLCEHRRLSRRVALKCLAPERSNVPEDVARFIRESEAVARLDHPNIIRAHDIGHHGTLYYLVLEYVEGVNLHQLVDDHQPLSVTRAVNYIVQACRGLQHAHESGLVHRDVKPANLMLDRSGIVKVSDLGLAKFNNSRTRDGKGEGVLGTVDFVSPEQALDPNNSDSRSDIYSLGATFYFLLTGQPPFSAATMPQILYKHQSSPTPSIAQARKDCPADFDVILRKMMEKNPAARPASCNAVIEIFKPWHQHVAPPIDEELPTIHFARSAAPDAGATTSVTQFGTWLSERSSIRR
jgi:serine/threonine protein kinase